MSANAGLIGVCERLPEDAKRGQAWQRLTICPAESPSDTELNPHELLFPAAA